MPLLSGIRKKGEMKMKKIIVLIMAVIIVLCAAGCEERQSDIVSYNISLEADNFNTVRQITLINCLQGDVLFQMTGKMSIEVDSTDNQLEVIVEEDDGVYKKHFIGLSDNVTYVVEDVTGNDVNNYNYVLNYNPKMWLPYTVETVD
jgi:uncharacterized lipoprotein NlpE involved in copper resistance